MSRLLWRDRVEVPRLFIAEQDDYNDGWRIRLRCPVTGDIEPIRLSATEVCVMRTPPDQVFMRWAGQLQEMHRRNEALTQAERFAVIRTERLPLLNRLLQEAQTAPPSHRPTREQRERLLRSSYGAGILPDRAAFEAMADYVRAFERDLGRDPREVNRSQLFRQAYEIDRDLFGGIFSSDDNAALLKAKDLLVAHLNPQQLQEFEAYGNFVVTRKGTTETYQITQSSVYNVVSCDTKNKFCGAFPGLPVFDQMLAQKLLIENDPEAFFGTANDHAKMQRRSQEQYQQERQRINDILEGRERPSEEQLRSFAADYREGCGCEACRIVERYRSEVQRPRQPREFLREDLRSRPY